MRAAEQAAQDADAAARAALAAGPQRAPLLLVRERRAERDARARPGSRAWTPRPAARGGVQDRRDRRDRGREVAGRAPGPA